MKVEQTKAAMVENVRSIVVNHEAALEMESKSLSIKDVTFNVRNDARRLEQEARRRRLMLWIIIGGIALVLILYITIPIVSKLKLKNK